MYTIYIKVNLTPMGQRLLNTNEYWYKMETVNKELADVAADMMTNSLIIGGDRYMFLANEFIESVMPAEMFDVNAIVIEEINYRPEEGEYVYLKVNLNSSSSMQIPFEVRYTDKDNKNGKTFSLVPIEQYDYTNANHELAHHTFTCENFFNVEHIRRRSFSLDTLQESKINRMSMTIVPMTLSEIQDIRSITEHGNLLKRICNIANNICENPSALKELSKDKLERILYTLEEACEDEEDTFGL